MNFEEFKNPTRKSRNPEVIDIENSQRILNIYSKLKKPSMASYNFQ